MLYVCPPAGIDVDCSASHDAAGHQRANCPLHPTSQSNFEFPDQYGANCESGCVFHHKPDGYIDYIAQSLVSQIAGDGTHGQDLPVRYRRCRKELSSVLRIRKRTKAEKILLLLVESGAIYCASGVSGHLRALFRDFNRTLL